jgi:hypothetical protein
VDAKIVGRLVKSLVNIQPPDIVEKDEELFGWSVSDDKIPIYNFRLETGRVDEYALLLRHHKPSEFNAVCDPLKHLVLQRAKLSWMRTNFDHEMGTQPENAWHIYSKAFFAKLEAT